MHEPGNDARFTAPPPVLALWAGWGLPVLAWMLHLNASYLLVGWVCETGRVQVLHGVTLGCLLVAIAGVLIAWRNWHVAGRQWPDGSGGPRMRSRFMGALGVFMGLLFTAIVAAQGLPNFLVPPCS